MGDRDAALTVAWRAGLGGNAAAYERALAGIAACARSRVRGRLAWASGELEDVVQETLLAVHLKRGSFDPRLPLLPWVHAIADRKSIDAVRRRQRANRLVAEGVALDAATERVPAEAPDTDRVGLDLDRHLATLPRREREVVHRLAVEGASVAETAAALGLGEGAVRVALHRGLKRLAAAARRHK